MSVLDQSPIPEGSTVGDALRNTLDLACLADRLGYRRYWLAEHHGSPGLACASPEIMIASVAAATARIRVGTGGVMLPHYSPLKVAETFSMLSSLFPGRIDLGVGRAPGSSPAFAYALQRDRRQPPPDDFREQLAELLGYFEKRPQPGPFRQFPALHFESPEPWLLGSSPQSSIWAAELGLPYAFADFINPGGAAFAAHYREHFQPSERLDSPRVAVAVWALCADSSAEALRLSASSRMMILHLYRGRLIPVPPVQRAVAFLEQEGVPMETLPPNRRLITGTPAEVRPAIESVARAYGAEEVFVINVMYDHVARRRSYELIAEAFDLPRQS